MRASFITNWHEKNSTEGKANVSAMRAVMRKLHQTNLGINLSYVKLHAKWNKAFAAIQAEADKPDS